MPTRSQRCSAHGRRRWLQPSSSALGAALAKPDAPRTFPNGSEHSWTAGTRPQIPTKFTQSLSATAVCQYDTHSTCSEPARASCRERSPPALRAGIEHMKPASARGGSDEPTPLLAHVIANSLQPAALGAALTAATQRLHAASCQQGWQKTCGQNTGGTDSLTQRVPKTMAERMTRILEHAAAAPAGHWTGRSAAELAQGTIVVRSLTPHVGHARDTFMAAAASGTPRNPGRRCAARRGPCLPQACSSNISTWPMSVTIHRKWLVLGDCR